MKSKVIKTVKYVLAIIALCLLFLVIYGLSADKPTSILVLPLLAYIPKNLDLKALLQKYPPKFRYNIDKFRYIISLITSIPAFNKEILDCYDFVPINKTILKKRVSDYPRYIEYLIKHGVFEINRQYVPGIRSQSYKFTPKYQTEIQVENIPNTTKNRAMTKRKEKVSNQKKYNYLYKWLNPMIHIDFKSALNYLQSELVANSKADLSKALKKFNATYANIYRIAESDFYFSIDNNIHRLHTNFTNLKKEYRNFITYNGQRLVAVDFVNSQPLISCALLHEDFYQTTKAGEEMVFGYNNYNISNQVSQYFNNNSSLSTSLSSLIMLTKDEVNDNRQGFQRFISECENGVIYEYLEKKLKEKCNIEVEDRKALKRIVFTTLFTDNRFLGQPEAEPKRLFKKMFPDVYRVFVKLKQGDKRFLPILLQSIESKLMLDYITRRISKERPDMPIWTIHDSVVCPVGNEQYVETVMQEETKKAIGVYPKVSFEYWTPDNLNSNRTSNEIQFSEPDIA